MQLEIERVHRKLLETSRLAGMAEVATAVLHNIGNVLNSVNISATLLTERVRKSSITAIGRVVQLLKEHEADLGSFFLSTPKGRLLPAYLAGLSQQLSSEQTEALEELTSLGKHIDHIKQIVAMQQSHAKISGVLTNENVIDLIEESLQMNEGGLERDGAALLRDYREPLPAIMVDRHKVKQILLNLIRNAKHACDDSASERKQITVQAIHAGQRIQIAVIDNGVGIPTENLGRIFNHGFITKEGGHGFGLHSGALAAKEMGGELRVSSGGPGMGATFVLELPIQSPVLLT
jgi:signal transduction histidine kinase